jgi:hypothetical protein
VHDGVIVKATSCSGHYRPVRFLNTQLEESLLLQGYTAPFEHKSCGEETVFFIDLDYKPVHAETEDLQAAIAAEQLRAFWGE